jgi:hypothetical protein
MGIFYYACTVKIENKKLPTKYSEEKSTKRIKMIYLMYLSHNDWLSASPYVLRQIC